MPHWPRCIPIVFTLVLGGMASGAPAGAGSDLGRSLAEDGDPARGLDACASCHGSDGGGSEEVAAPRLAAIGAGYLARQIQNFRNGNRKHPIMQLWAELLTEAEIEAVAKYYQQLPPASQAQVPRGLDPKDGEWLALFGDWANRRLPACVQCHGPVGVGVGDHFPALAGQPYNYLVGQLAAWTTGERKGDPLGMMAAMNPRLSVAESQAVAAYFASQPAAPAVARAQRIDSGGEMPDAAGLRPPQDPASKADGEAAAAPAEVHQGPLPHLGRVQSGGDVPAGGLFRPPPRDQIPEGPFGDMVRLGEAIFLHTDSHRVSGKYVGNAQACEGCHLDAGRLADSAPMWAAWVSYPAYRNKNKEVNTMIERLQGCFKYSMNAQDSRAGGPPAAGSRTIHALLSYMYWLATGAPTGDQAMAGRGFPKLAETDSGFDSERGAKVYADKCAICHGDDGDGGWAAGEMVFPPLWGEQSYNWGAGMHRINTAAAFIAANMPLGNFIELTAQEAWDVAAFINSHERPQDPRFNGDLAETKRGFHGSKYDYYGVRKGPSGRLLGEPPPSSAANSDATP